MWILQFCNFFALEQSQRSAFANTFLWRPIQFGDGQRERNCNSTLQFEWNEEIKQNNRSSQGSNWLIPALPTPAIPVQDLPSALPTNWAGTKGGKQKQKGENFHHLQLYFQFPPGTGGTVSTTTLWGLPHLQNTKNIHINYPGGMWLFGNGFISTEMH